MATVMNIKSERERINDAIDYLLSNVIKSNECQKNEVQPPIGMPDNFLLSVESAKGELENIKKHANEICRIVSDCETSTLLLLEEYFQLKLDAHIGRKQPMVEFMEFMIYVFVILLFVAFGNNLDISLSIKIVAAIFSFVGLFAKYKYKETHLDSTISYKYCMLIIKRSKLMVNKNRGDS
jgi:hypothetical protein